MFARMITRLIPHSHESTVTHFVTLTMSLKKMFGRFIIGMITSSALVAVASIVLGVAEVAAALSLDAVDLL